MIEIETGSRIRICGRFFFQNGSSYISGMNWDMAMKFGLLIDFDFSNTLALTSRKPEIVLNRRGRHLEKSMWRHISALGGPIYMKFGNFMQNNNKNECHSNIIVDKLHRYRTDYGDVVKVKTGRRISIWRTFVSAKRKQLYLGHKLSYPDDIWYADRHCPTEKNAIRK